MCKFGAKMILTLLLAVGTVKCSPGAGYEWTYEGEHGPREWPEHFANCNGSHQSPINIVERLVQPAQFKPLQFQHADQPPTQLLLKNNNHTATAVLQWDKVPTVQGGQLDASYSLIGFHFHWGYKSFLGSEHTIDGEHYPMEMHLVWRNVNYDTFSEAVNHEDGLAVFAVMFQVSEKDGQLIAPLESALASIIEGDTQHSVAKPPTLASLLPTSTDSYYRYSGSLTTPTCNEAVTWTVFDQAVNVSERQLQLFRALETNNRRKLDSNFRPVQERHERIVYHTGPSLRPNAASAATSCHHNRHQSLLQLAAVAVTAAELLRPSVC